MISEENPIQTDKNTLRTPTPSVGVRKVFLSVWMGFSSEIIQIYKAHFRKYQEIAIWMGFPLKSYKFTKQIFGNIKKSQKGNLA